MFDCCRYTGKFYHGYEFIVGMIVVNLFIFLLIIPIEKTFIYLPYICIADVALIFVYYIIFLYIRHYHRANKIEDAIQYGIIGTKVCNNSCYKEDEGKSYKIKNTNTNIHILIVVLLVKSHIVNTMGCWICLIKIPMNM